MQLEAAIREAALRIAPDIRRTPVEHSPWLSDLTGSDVYLKLENYQVTGSFKVRGALNKLGTLSEQDRKSGVIAASSGNHGLGVAFGASLLDIKATVFVPIYAEPSKVAAIKALGATVFAVGDDCLKTEEAARTHAHQNNLTYISPYNDPDVIAGQGTVALELLTQLENLDAVFIALGGGGLLSGMGSFIKAVSPNTSVIACSPARSPAMHECLLVNKVIDVPCHPTLSDATAGGVEPGSITLALCKEVIDQSLLVTEEEIRSALVSIMNNHHMLIEGAAAVAVAGLLQSAAAWRNKRTAVLLCGANIGLGTLGETLRHHR